MKHRKKPGKLIAKMTWRVIFVLVFASGVFESVNNRRWFWATLFAVLVVMEWRGLVQLVRATKGGVEKQPRGRGTPFITEEEERLLIDAGILEMIRAALQSPYPIDDTGGKELLGIRILGVRRTESVISKFAMAYFEYSIQPGEWLWGQYSVSPPGRYVYFGGGPPLNQEQYELIMNVAERYPSNLG